MTVGICIAIALVTLGLHVAFGFVVLRGARRYVRFVEQINDEYLKETAQINREHKESVEQINREHEARVARIDGRAPPVLGDEPKAN